jgi:hypothetical protein
MYPWVNKFVKNIYLEEDVWGQASSKQELSQEKNKRKEKVSKAFEESLKLKYLILLFKKEDFFTIKTNIGYVLKPDIKNILDKQRAKQNTDSIVEVFYKNKEETSMQLLVENYYVNFKLNDFHKIIKALKDIRDYIEHINDKDKSLAIKNEDVFLCFILFFAILPDDINYKFVSNIGAIFHKYGLDNKANDSLLNLFEYVKKLISNIYILKLSPKKHPTKKKKKTLQKIKTSKKIKKEESNI